jgi:hypothetical protein
MKLVNQPSHGGFSASMAPCVTLKGKQEKQEPKKRSKFIAPLVAVALTAATLGGVGVGLTSCVNPTTETPQHQHDFGNAATDYVWENTWTTDVWATNGEGRGYRKGTKEVYKTCQADGYKEQISFDNLTYEDVFAIKPEYTTTIQMGYELQPNGDKVQHTHSYQWEDTGVRDQWRDLGGNREIEQKQQVYKCKTDGTTIDTTVGNGGYQWVDIVGTERDKQQALTLPSISGANVDTLAPLVSSTASNVIHDNTSLTEFSIQYGVGPTLFAGYSAQAELLCAFFAGATNPPTKFSALAGFENTIKTAGVGATLTERLNTVDAQRTAIINKIFEGKDATTFNLYWDAYTKGNYVNNADWATGPRTVDGVDNTDIAAAVGRYVAALGDLPVALTTPTSGSTTYLARGQDAGNYGNITLQLDEMQGILKTQIVTALGLDTLAGGQLANADDMAEALIIQLGQDHEEYKALVNDLQAEGRFGNLFNDTIKFASLGSQSSTRLAALV